MSKGFFPGRSREECPRRMRPPKTRRATPLARARSAAGARAALGAKPVELHLVMAQRDAEFARDRLLEFLDRLVFEFDDAAAAFADEVVVMMVAGDFIARLALLEVALVDQVAFLEQAQRAVDGGVADVRIDLLDFGVELLGADMAAQREEDARDVVALAGRLEPALFEARYGTPPSAARSRRAPDCLRPCERCLPRGVA